MLPDNSTITAPTATGIDIIWCDFGGVLTPHLDEAIGHIVEASGVPWPILMDAAALVAGNLGLTGLAPLELGLLSQAEWGARVADELPREQDRKSTRLNSSHTPVSRMPSSA